MIAKTLTLSAGVLAVSAATAGAVDLVFDKTAWSGGETVSLTELTLNANDYTSWELSFDFDYKAGTTSNEWGTVILATGTNPTADSFSGGFQIYWSNSSSKNGTGEIFVKYGDDNAKLYFKGENSETVKLDFNDDATLSFTIGYNYVTDTLSATLTSGGIESTVSVESTTDISFSSLTTTGAESLSEGATDWTYSKLKGTAVALPEPSAFGLLAGIGALALVAARRRRGRKA